MKPITLDSTHIKQLKNLGITLEQGKKSINDKIVIFHGSSLSLEILGKIYSKMCKLENKLYPDGQDIKFLSSYLEDIRKGGGLTTDIMIKYGISKTNNEVSLELWGQNVTKEILGNLYSEMCKIQDILYPNGKGAKYLAEYLEEIRKTGDLTDDIRRRFKV